jgi:hypothetical protein
MTFALEPTTVMTFALKPAVMTFALKPTKESLKMNNHE